MKEKKYWNRLGCILLAIFTVYFIVTGLTYTFGTHEEIVIGIQNGEANVPVGEITMETVVEQMFPAVDDTVEVSVLFATYARTNTGNVVVKITGDSSGNTYFSNTYDASLFEDNQYVDFRLYL